MTYNSTILFHSTLMACQGMYAALKLTDMAKDGKIILDTLVREQRGINMLQNDGNILFVPLAQMEAEKEKYPTFILKEVRAYDINDHFMFTVQKSNGEWSYCKGDRS